MQTNQPENTTFDAFLDVTRNGIKKTVLSLEKELKWTYNEYIRTPLTLPFVRLVHRKDILQMRMRVDPHRSESLLLLQKPVIWLSYDWRNNPGMPSHNHPGNNYIDFEWLGVTIRAIFEPKERWEDREFIFRFRENGTSVLFYAKLSLGDFLPPLPPPIYNDEREAPPKFKEVRQHIYDMLQTKKSMHKVIDAFDKLSDRYL